MTSAAMGPTADLMVEFLLQLATSAELSLTDARPARRPDGDIWEISFRFQGRRYDAVLDSKAGQLVIEEEDDRRVRATATDDGFLIPPTEYEDAREAAAYLARSVTKAVDPWS